MINALDAVTLVLTKNVSAELAVAACEALIAYDAEREVGACDALTAQLEVPYKYPVKDPVKDPVL